MRVLNRGWVHPAHRSVAILWTVADTPLSIDRYFATYVVANDGQLTSSRSPGQAVSKEGIQEMSITV